MGKTPLFLHSNGQHNNTIVTGGKKNWGGGAKQNRYLELLIEKQYLLPDKDVRFSDTKQYLVCDNLRSEFNFICELCELF